MTASGAPEPSEDPFPELPVDPDLAEPRSLPQDPSRRRRTRTGRASRSGLRAAHLQPRLVGLVLAGGAVGAPLRYLISQVWPTPTDGFPWATFTINGLGAFALGLLLEVLARAGADTGRRRAARLLLGTGVLGAFTTYSTLAVEADLLIRAHHDELAALYAVGSVAAGLLAALAGIVVGAGSHRAIGRSRAAEPGGTGNRPQQPPEASR